MSNTIHTLEWQGKKGVIRLEASYQASLQEKINNLDGDICPSGELEIVEQASLTAYFNGKRLAFRLESDIMVHHGIFYAGSVSDSEHSQNRHLGRNAG